MTPKQHTHPATPTHQLGWHGVCDGGTLLQPYLNAGQHLEGGQTGIWVKPTPAVRHVRVRTHGCEWQLHLVTRGAHSKRSSSAHSVEL
jgi:hypothetical protein